MSEQAVLDELFQGFVQLEDVRSAIAYQAAFLNCIQVENGKYSKEKRSLLELNKYTNAHKAAVATGNKALRALRPRSSGAAGSSSTTSTTAATLSFPESYQAAFSAMRMEIEQLADEFFKSKQFKKIVLADKLGNTLPEYMALLDQSIAAKTDKNQTYRTNCLKGNLH